MRKKIALLLSIIMIVASMPLTAFAADGNRVYGALFYSDFYELDSNFNPPPTGQPGVIDGNTVTDLIVVASDLKSHGVGLPLKDKTKLQNAVINCRYVQPFLFKGFKNLKTVEFYYGVHDINQFILEDTAVEKVTIPSSVTGIEINAFENMPKLTEIQNDSDSGFTVNVGGVEYKLNPHSLTKFDLRLEKANLFVDKKDNNFSLNLKTLGNGDEAVTFTAGSTLPEGYTLSEDGILSSTNIGDASNFDTIITLTTPSKTVDAQVSLQFYDSSIKSGIFQEEGSFARDPYSYDVSEGTFGDDLVTPFEPYTIKFNDKYGKIFSSDVFAKDIYDGVDYYAFGNEITIFSGILDGEDLILYSMVCSGEDDIKDSKNCTLIEKTPFTATDVIDENGLRVPSANYEYGVFADAYKIPFSHDDVITVKVNDINKYTDLQLIVISEGVTYDDDYFYEENFLNNNNFDSSGESTTLICEEYAKEGCYYIMPTQGSNDFLGSNYKITVEKNSKYVNFPSQVTLDEKPLDFIANPDSVTDENGKYSWDSATKILTLEDGFYLKHRFNENGNPSIILPGNATVVVKGNVGIDSTDDAIYFVNPERTLNSKIILEKGACLNIDASNDGINFESKTLDIIGTPDENGNLPKLKFHADSDGIETVLDTSIAGDENLATLNVKNVYFDIFSDNEGIELDNGLLRADNIKGEIYSNDYQAIYTENIGYFESENDIGVEIKNSDIILETGPNNGREGIQTETGGIKITNSKLYIYTPDDDGLLVYNKGNVVIEDSDIKVVAGDDGIRTYENNINITGTKLAIVAGDNIIEAIGGATIDGSYDLYDYNNKLVYSGPLQDLIKLFDDGYDQYYYLELLDENGDHIYLNGMIQIPLKSINLGDVKVSATKNDYTQGENIEILIDTPEYDESLRYQAVSWEVVGTDLKGKFEKDSKELLIPTDTLAPGQYTVRIAIAKQKLQINGRWVNVTDAQGKEDISYKTITINVLAKTENAPVKSPETGADMNILLGIVLMLGLSLSVMTITSRKKRTNK